MIYNTYIQVHQMLSLNVRCLFIYKINILFIIRMRGGVSLLTQNEKKITGKHMNTNI